MTAIVVAPDEIKASIEGYKESDSEKYHLESVALADVRFKEYLKDKSLPQKVILMCGGGASGKSEYIERSLMSEDAIIYDGTLSTTVGAQTKIRNIKRYHKECYLYAIIVESLVESFHAFINRDRQYPYERFYETHSGARSVLKYVLQNFPDVHIKVIKSYTGGYKSLRFKILYDDVCEEMVEYIQGIQKSESEVEKIVSEPLE